MRLSRSVLILALSTSAAGAQLPIARPAGVVRPVSAGPMAAQNAIPPVAAEKMTRTERVGIAALAGTILGGAIGAVLAAETVHGPSVKNPSEDGSVGIVYGVFIGGGLVIGFVAGALVGLAWPD